MLSVILIALAPVRNSFCNNGSVDLNVVFLHRDAQARGC